MGHLTITFEILNKARALVKDCGLTQPPIDLYKLAVAQGIKEVRLDHMRLDGELRRITTGGYVVSLNSKLSDSRRRFTLAHEIAHTLLLEDSRFADVIGHENSRLPEEELCNLVAAELLIPDAMIRPNSLFSTKLTVQSVLDVAKTFQCSISAAAMKLLNTTSTTGVLLIWNLDHDSRQQYLRLSASPGTLGLKIPFRNGMKLVAGDMNWNQLVSGNDGTVELSSPDIDLTCLGERLRINSRTILVLIAIPQTRRSKTPRSQRLSQRKLPFEQ
jgi:hypothetical protein